MDKGQPGQGGERTGWDGPTDPDANRPPADNRASRAQSQNGPPANQRNTPSAQVPDFDTTVELPKGYVPPPLPRRLPKADGTTPRRTWLFVVSFLLVVVVIIAGAYAAFSAARGAPVIPFIPTIGCGSSTPCGVANGYLDAYTSGKYDTMYSFISDASQKRFSDPKILNGNFTDAKDYVVTRTSSILAEAHVYEISATPGDVSQTTDTSATVPVRVVMTSSYVGTITQDLTLPLVKEKNVWRVNWSPGLIFSQLDDAQGDPQYQRKVHLFIQDAKRGSILDRDGNVLAKDDTVYSIYVVPSKVQDQGTLVSTLAQNLDFTTGQIQDKLSGAKSGQNVFIRTISPQLYQQVSPKLTGLAGIQIQTSIERVYPYGVDTAPITGYVRPVSADDLKADTQDYYQQTDEIGRAGVEKWGEQMLRPTRGGTLQIVDVNGDGSLGNAAFTIAQRDPVNGSDITTTITLATQRAAMASLRNQAGHSGGSMAVDPATGEVLVLATYPTYDPNDLALGLTPNAQTRLNALDAPYIDRAIGSAQPVGSVFKLVTLAAGLEHGVSATRTFSCTGSYQVPGEAKPRADDQPKGHGTITAPFAITPSCDVVFWQIAVELNMQNQDWLPDMAKAIGFGSRTGIVGIDPSEENPGLVPDASYLQQTKNAKWTPTDAANLAIGQGFFQATPAQVAELSAAIGNNGVRMQPRLVSSVSSGGQTLQTYPAKQLGTLPISADNLATIQASMLGPLYDPKGTAVHDFDNVSVRVAGKTGTAESGQAHPHSWFTVYAPASPLSGPHVVPKIAVGTLVEYSDLGEKFAVPVSRVEIKTYLHA